MKRNVSVLLILLTCLVMVFASCVKKIDPHGTVTRENAEKITEGMTMDEVINILGKDKGEMQGSGMIIYVWPVDDGRYLYTWWRDKNPENDEDEYIVTDVEIRAKNDSVNIEKSICCCCFDS